MNRAKLLKKARPSLFLKLSLVFVGTAVVVVGLVFGMIDHFSKVHDHVWMVRNKNRVEYGRHLADEVGNPPDLAKAAELVKRLSIRVRIDEAGKAIFKSQENVPNIEELNSIAHHCVWEPLNKIVTYQGRFYINITREPYQYLFSYENGNFLDERPEWGPLLIAVIILAFLMNFIFIRWLFQPIEWLSEGVKQVQEGNLEHQVKIRGTGDEFDDLTASFNQMTRQILEMFRSKEQLLLDVSHELRSPITRIKVALEIDDERSPDQIKKNIRDLEVMISELLESARLDTPRGGLNLAQTSISNLIHKVALKFKDEKPGIKIVGNIPENLSLELDALRIETVLKNIFENALKYSHHQNEAVEVSVKIDEEEKEVHIRVRDYGYGVPEEERALIFEPFYRVDKSRVRETGGYGLGLALCKKIILAHQGTIEVLGATENGAIVLIRFKMT